jgi:N-acetylglucosamine-6-phosphate deacetylase
MTQCDSNSNSGALEARRYDTGELVRIAWREGQIAAVEPALSDLPVSEIPWVAPALFDLQINGYGGVWFSHRSLTPHQVVAAIDPYFSHGVTRLCPTLITSSHETLVAGFSAIRIACDEHAWLNRAVAGCHLEGPFLSLEDGPRGAHPRAHIRPADWDEFTDLQTASGNRIRLVTIAPEVPHAIEFTRRAVAAGVRIAIGHTAASAEQIQEAVAAGATLSTHLGNGAHPILRRHPNYIWEQLGESRLAASIIADGEHLPDSVIRSIVRAKSVAQMILTCDASGWIGCAPGSYENELGQVEVLDGGRIVVAGQREILAGSGVPTDFCVAYATHCGAATLREAIDMASRNPARFLGLPDVSLCPGQMADLFVYRLVAPTGQLEVLATISAGELRHGTIPKGSIV